MSGALGGQQSEIEKRKLEGGRKYLKTLCRR